MQTVQVVVSKIMNTYWIGSRNDCVYGIFPLSDAMYPNVDYPVDLDVRTFVPGAKFSADTYRNRGGILLNGTISLNGLTGILTSDLTINWSNGDVWNRTENTTQPLLNKYSPQVSRWMAEKESEQYSKRIENRYPVYSQYQGL
jgi:hypothetical protein